MRRLRSIALPAAMAVCLALVAWLLFRFNPSLNTPDAKAEIKDSLAKLKAPQAETRKIAAERLGILYQDLSAKRIEGDPAWLKPATGPLLDMLQDSSAEVRRMALWSASEIGLSKDQGTPQLLKALNDNEEKVREYAMRLLRGRELTTPEARAAYMDVLKQDRSPHLRRQAADELLRMTTGSARVELLVSWLDDTDSGISQKAFEELQANTEVAVKYLFNQRFATDDSKKRQRIAAHLKRLDPTNAIVLKLVVGIIEDSQFNTVTLYTLSNLGIDKDEHLAVVIDACFRSSHNMEEAVSWCGMLDIDSLKNPAVARRIVPHIIRNLNYFYYNNSSDPQFRLLLLKYGTEALPTVQEMLNSNKDSDIDEAAGAAVVLGPIAKDTLPRLMQLTKESKWTVAECTARLLYKLAQEDDAIITQVIGMAAEKDYGTHTTAYKVLYQLGPRAEAAVPVLLEQLNTAKFVYYDLTMALGRVGANQERVLNAFIDYLKKNDSSRDSKEQVALGIAAMGPKGRKAETILLEMIGQNRLFTKNALRALQEIGAGAEAALPKFAASLKSPNANERMEAVYAMGEAARFTTKARPYLIEALKDASPTVRWEAASAIEELGNKDQVYLGALKSALAKETHNMAKDALARAITKLETTKR